MEHLTVEEKIEMVVVYVEAGWLADWLLLEFDNAVDIYDQWIERIEFVPVLHFTVPSNK